MMVSYEIATVIAVKIPFTRADEGDLNDALRRG
jgi:hypothetical protein